MTVSLITVAAVVAALTQADLHLPKCTLLPEAPHFTLAEAREVVWQAYQTSKVDRQRKGSTIFDEYFGWKDQAAANRLGLTLKEYVVHKVRDDVIIAAARMFKAMERDGLRVGVTSAYRDAWRQEKATGNKSATHHSFHGSRPELGGRGVALDVVAYSDDGDRQAQLRKNPVVWAWIDKHGKHFGLGRPYGDRDAPHVGPLSGKEYIAKRGGGVQKVAKAKRKAPHKVRVALRQAPATPAGPTVRTE